MSQWQRFEGFRGSQGLLRVNETQRVTKGLEQPRIGDTRVMLDCTGLV